MKTVARISIVLACLAILLAAGYVLSSRLSVSGSVTVTSAAENKEAFDDLKARWPQAGLTAQAQAYSFVTLSVDMKSFSPFKTEWINLIVENENGAIVETESRNAGEMSLQKGDLLVSEKNTWIRRMDAFGKLEGADGLYITFLASASEQPSLRAYVEYYIFGRYHRQEIELTY